MNKMKYRFSRTGVHFGKNEGMVRSGIILCMEDGGVDSRQYKMGQSANFPPLLASSVFRS